MKGTIGRSGTRSAPSWIVIGSPSSGIWAKRYPLLIVSRLLVTLVDRDDLPVFRPHVGGLRTDQTVVRELLHDVRGPARGPGTCEDVREEVARDAECVVDRRAEEVDVRVDRPAAALHLLGHDSPDLLGDLEPLRLAGLLGKLGGEVAQDRRARVERL